MTYAKLGDRVKVHYTGSLENGSVFGSSLDRKPLEFQIGEGRLIPGFEKAVVGMEPGNLKRTKISPEEAYGSRLDSMIHTIRRDLLPESFELEVGQQLEMVMQNGDKRAVTVIEVDEKRVTVDANHPLAGLDLTFEIQLVEIV